MAIGSSFSFLWQTLLDLLFPSDFPPSSQELTPKVPPSNCHINQHLVRQAITNAHHPCSAFHLSLKMLQQDGLCVSPFSRTTPPLSLIVPVGHLIFSVLTLMAILFITCLLWTQNFASNTDLLSNPRQLFLNHLNTCLTLSWCFSSNAYSVLDFLPFTVDNLYFVSVQARILPATSPNLSGKACEVYPRMHPEYDYPFSGLYCFPQNCHYPILLLFWVAVVGSLLPRRLLTFASLLHPTSQIKHVPQISATGPCAPQNKS